MRARTSRFRAAFAAAGHSSVEAIAREIGMVHKSVQRALDGDAVGAPLMANTIYALSRNEYQPFLTEIGIAPTLDSLFEIVVDGDVDGD